MTHHATAVAFGDRAVLLRGAPGAGKSDLAMRMLCLQRDSLSAFGIADMGEIALIADDRVVLTQSGGDVFASAPDALQGKLEVRGLGIQRVTAICGIATVQLVVDLVSADHVERMPDAAATDIEGITLPLVSVAPFEASAPLKVALALFARVAP